MALGNATFTNFGAAVNDLFSSQANAAGLRIKASGTELEAQGTRIQAEGSRLTAKGDLTEAGNYDLAASLATENAQFTEASTRIQQTMADRQIYQAIGTEKAGFAGAGLSDNLDLLRDSASQGALQKALIGSQGQIAEAGYTEQAQSFTNLSSYAKYGASVENDIADKQDAIAGGQDQIAQQERDLADQTQTNGYISAGIHAATAIASIFV